MRANSKIAAVIALLVAGVLALPVIAQEKKAEEKKSEEKKAEPAKPAPAKNETKSAAPKAVTLSSGLKVIDHKEGQGEAVQTGRG